MMPGGWEREWGYVRRVGTMGDPGWGWWMGCWLVGSNLRWLWGALPNPSAPPREKGLRSAPQYGASGDWGMGGWGDVVGLGSGAFRSFLAFRGSP